MVALAGWFFLCLPLAQSASSQQDNAPARWDRRLDRPQGSLDASVYRDDPSVPWHIAADEILFDDRENVYIAKGNVSITKPRRNLSADWVRFDQRNMKAEARGNVVLVAGNDVFTGARAEIDLTYETGTLYQGTVFLSQNHFHIKGERIEKLGPATYAAEKASVTTCDGNRPDWKITGRKLNVTVEGYGSITHGTMWAGPIPFVYAPLFFFPAKTKRQTGLLAPQFGYSERTWESYTQPFFWAISDSSDATFYINHMERRGTRPGVEYRWAIAEDSFGTLMADGFNDAKIDNGLGESSRLWGYTGDGALRPNKDRWWLRMKTDHRFANDFNLMLDIDLVSDQDYLQEFKDGYMGFEKTDDYFTKTFGRDLDTEDETARLNRMLVNRIWPAWSLNAETRWYDDVVNRRQGGVNGQVQQLPLVQFTGAKQKLAGSSFYFDMDSAYEYTYQEQRRRRHRADLYPRVYYPTRFQRYLAVEPSVGARETVWYMDHDDTTPASKDSDLSRHIYDTRLDLSSQVYRIFDFNTDAYDRIKHAVRPRIVHDYLPSHNQNRFPDTVAKRNVVTYSLTNFFTLRSRPTEDPNAAAPEAMLPHYRQFSRFRVLQSYDINAAKDDDTATRADANRRTPFSPVVAELLFAPTPYLSLEADAARSPYHGHYDYHNVGAAVADRRGDRLTVEHRYRHKTSETIFSELEIVLTPKLSTYVDYERNRRDDRDVSHGIGFFYESQCWAFQAEYVEEEDDRRYAFMIHFEGLGKIGKGIQARKLENPMARD